jgi:hypothetical protein
MAPDQVATSPVSASVEPSPSTLSQTITFHMKMTTGSASSGRMIAVYQRPCSATIRAAAHLRASISAAMVFLASDLSKSPSWSYVSSARDAKFLQNPRRQMPSPHS